MVSQAETIRAAKTDAQTGSHPAMGSAGLGVWLHWVVYTTVGYLFYETTNVALSLAFPGLGGIVAGLVAGILGVGVVAFLQWLVLRHNIPGIRWPSWVVATILGQFLGTLAVIFALLTPVILGVLGDLPEQIGSQTVNISIVLLSGAIMGAILGVAQWIVFARHLKGAHWWILATAVGGAINKAVQTTPLATGASGIVLTRATGWFIFAIITGIMLIWLLRRQREGVPPDSSDTSTSPVQTATTAREES
jgi:hypothetical protein